MGGRKKGKEGGWIPEIRVVTNENGEGEHVPGRRARQSLQWTSLHLGIES